MDLKERLIRLRAEDVKTRRSRIIPIAEELYSMLVGIPASISGDIVFLHRGAPFLDFRTGLRLACDEAGIVYGRKEEGGFTFHDLRHTFVTDLRKAGVQQSVIMSLAGHEDRSMFRRYDSVDIEDLRQAIRELERYRTEVKKALVDQNVD